MKSRRRKTAKPTDRRNLLQRTAGPYIRVMSGKPQSEHIWSALPPKAEVGRRGVNFCWGPILLQKSLKRPGKGDSVVPLRIGGGGDDGAAGRPGSAAVVLFV